MKTRTIGLIAGTGMGEVLSESGLPCHSNILRENPFGSPVVYSVFKYRAFQLIMLDRHHNTGEPLPPGRLNREAYMYALWKLRVGGILGISAVGTPYKKDGLRQGDLVVIGDAIDYVQDYYTFEREGFADLSAFYRPTNNLFCPHLRHALENGDHLSDNRFVLANSIKRPGYETPAEMKVRVRDGVDVVGMPTAFPEALLAGELSIPYGLLCGVSNVAPAKHNGQAVGDAMKAMVPEMMNRILQALDWLADNEHPTDCPCREGRKESVFDMLGVPSFE
ncbi:MAG: hypothetical protein HOE19_02115 [Candidatus Komeilibacteria bacterium]|jgi:purine nucleoside phosphorylase|nr:hypothetical protein [Candidatus Komeilibacteria bacterium]MBT4447211.1 hypothetical protein [Candidatus Komeilibacteria bacterium]